MMDDQLTITNIVGGGPADGKLGIGHRIVEVSGVKVANRKEYFRAFRMSGNSVTFLVHPPVACGKITGSFVANVRSCIDAYAKPGHDARQSPQACWDYCSGNWHSAVVWKQGSCGCVPSRSLDKCSSGSSDNYEYYELSPVSCVNTG